MQNESKPKGWSVGLFVLSLVVVLGYVAFHSRIHEVRPWLKTRYPHVYPALLGLMALGFAYKLTFKPSTKDLESGFRWLWIPVWLVAAGLMLAEALS